MPTHTATLAQADRQEDFLRALRESEGTPVNPQALLLFLLTLALTVAVLYYLQQRSAARSLSREGGLSSPRPARRVLRNPRRLQRDVARELNLSRADLRKLEHHARRLGIEHPLTLLLCPSLTHSARRTGDANSRTKRDDTPPPPGNPR